MDFPAMRAHAGIWEGTYTHLDQEGVVEDRHRARVVCEFPENGEVFYRQHIFFEWEDGRVRDDRFDGVIRDGAVWFDTPTFHGRSWETDAGIVLLHLDRKDEPDACFQEVILMGEGGRHRARTWHWFRDGRLFRRTLCDEVRAG